MFQKHLGPDYSCWGRAHLGFQHSTAGVVQAALPSGAILSLFLSPFTLRTPIFLSLSDSFFSSDFSSDSACKMQLYAPYVYSTLFFFQVSVYLSFAN